MMSQIAAPLLLADPVTGNTSVTASVAHIGASGVTPMVFDASTAGHIGRLCYRFGEFDWSHSQFVLALNHTSLWYWY